MSDGYLLSDMRVYTKCPMPGGYEASRDEAHAAAFFDLTRTPLATQA